MTEDDIECEYFTVVFTDALLAYDKKYYLQVYLNNFAYKTVNKRMADIFMKIFSNIRYYKCCITIRTIKKGN